MFRFLIIFISCDIASSEYKNKTIIPIMTTPMRRNSLIIGKFTAILLIVLVFESLSFSITLLITNSVFTYNISISTIWMGYCAMILITPTILAFSLTMSFILKKTIPSFIFQVSYIFLIEPLLSKVYLTKLSIDFLINSQITHLTGITQRGAQISWHNFVAFFSPGILIPIVILIICFIFFQNNDIKEI